MVLLRINCAAFDYYQPCVKDASYEEWCNIPNTTPTEQMIAVYHKGTMVFAYKGYFNCTTGLELFYLMSKKGSDLCTINNGRPPAPSVHVTGILGLTFDKASPTNHYCNCNTYNQGSTLTVSMSVVGVTVSFHLPSVAAEVTLIRLWQLLSNKCSI